MSDMDLKLLIRRSEYQWEIPQHGAMRVPAVIYASEQLMRDMDHKVYEQAVNVAALPGIVRASYAMPDAHWGYGFPIGGVAAFDPREGGVVSAGGVGFDISCGVRCLRTGLRRDDILRVQRELANALYTRIPAGVGSTGAIRLNEQEMDAMLTGGAKWAVERGWGVPQGLDRIEEHRQMKHAKPAGLCGYRACAPLVICCALRRRSFPVPLLTSVDTRQPIGRRDIDQGSTESHAVPA
jgi:tRNA-splicing ligase RtcB